VFFKVTSVVKFSLLKLVLTLKYKLL